MSSGNADKILSQQTILGLHFGHDAGAVVLAAGRVMAYVLRERLCRTKHALGLDVSTIESALAAASITIDDVDCVAVSSTQGLELVVLEPDLLQIRYLSEDVFGRPCDMLQTIRGWDHEQISRLGARDLRGYLFDSDANSYVAQCYAAEFPEGAGMSREDFEFVPWLDDFAVDRAWSEPVKLGALGNIRPEVSTKSRYGFHIPVAITLRGRTIYGYAIHHHFAHAASSYYRSGFQSAAILTHDGYGLRSGYHSGMFYLGLGEGIYPLWPHNLTVGYLYEHVANSIGMGVVGGAGKLMGLAAYGSSQFYDETFVGNAYDFEGHADVSAAWLEFCLAAAQTSGQYEMDAYARLEKAICPINADIAASTQRILEETKLQAAVALRSQLENCGYGQAQLCLSGGTALNCPSNSLIAKTNLFEKVFVEPSCDDSGIALGAALAVHHNVFGSPLVPDPSRSSPFQGRTYAPASIRSAIAARAPELKAGRCTDAAALAAEDLVNGLIVGWFEGPSEIGPRALGHRSILADPRSADTWERVNRLKGRESWRPLAPSVLESEAADWFGDCPLPSPYMLYNASVLRSGIPAVTHLDGTARIQTVNATTGDFYRIIEEFWKRTGVPVVLNTSMNGPREPIADHPAEALQLLLDGRFEVLYINAWRVVRNVG